MQAEAGDQEMTEAEPMAEEAGGGEVPRAADIEMGPDGLESMDESFLEALPADLRAEMLQAQANMARQTSAAAQNDQRVEGAPDEPTAMSQDGQPTQPAQAAAEPSGNPAGIQLQAGAIQQGEEYA